MANNRMDNLSKALEDTKAVFGGSLIEGSHESITMFGVHAQNGISDCARRVSAILAKDEGAFDGMVEDILAKIDLLESEESFPSSFRRRKRNCRALDDKEREALANSIEDAALRLKLHQMQLAKENELLTELGGTLSASVAELDCCIETGRGVLEGHGRIPTPASAPASILDRDSDREAWYSRLERRLEDLAISRTLALQTQAQIKLLRENNLIAFDRIAATVTNLAAICQAQIAIDRGTSLFQKRLEGCEAILEACGTRLPIE